MHSFFIENPSKTIIWSHNKSLIIINFDNHINSNNSKLRFNHS